MQPIGPLNKLGTKIAKKCDWQGLQILEIFYHALTDANYHTQAAEVEKMIIALELENIEIEE